MKAFYDALAQVQKEIIDPEKNKEVKGRQIKFEYADLPAVLKQLGRYVASTAYQSHKPPQLWTEC